MVKISSSMDKDKKAFRTASFRPETRGEIEDDRPSMEPSDDAELAPGLDGVEGMDEPATERETNRGDSTRVTKLVYDEYDES